MQRVSKREDKMALMFQNNCLGVELGSLFRRAEFRIRTGTANYCEALIA